MSQKDWKKRYLSIIEEIEDGYAEVDLKGNLTNVNKALCDILGYTREEMIGKSHRKFVNEEQAKRGIQVYNQVFKTGRPVKSYVYEAYRKDGTKRILDVSISLNRDQAEAPNGFQGIYRDITDLRKAQEEIAAQKSRLEAIFRSVNEGIISVDPEMRIIEINQTAKEICGMAADLKIGRSFVAVDYCDNTCRDVFQEVLSKKTSIKEFNIDCRRKDQVLKKLILSSSPLINDQGEHIGAILVIRDITRLRDLEKQLIDRHQYHNIIGKNKKMQEIYCLLDDLANIETTVLISGENGTGKEVIAKALHYSGNRALKPFVTVNCSALAENLLESELFGHVKGSFTGALKDRDGRFKTADKGTIFLDEIGDISSHIQLKLLRVLQEKEFEPVGSSKTIKVDVRLIASTNRDLKALVDKGEFREDLYYRLKVIEINIPPLRERLDDLPLLVDYFCQKFNKNFLKEINGVDEDVMKALMDYHWPGNIRELEHTLERAFILCREQTIRLEHLPPEIIKGSKQPNAKPVRKEWDDSKELLAMLQKTGWNKSKTARLMGLSRLTIYRKMIKYGLNSPLQ
jgi:two-component system, NtrC family, response regulator HydG